MRRRIDPLPFSSQYSFACWKAFVYAGVQYQNGDPFPAEGVEKPDSALLEKLYRQKLITVAEAPEKPVGAVKTKVKAKAKPPLAAEAESAQVQQASEEDTNAQSPADGDDQSAGDAGGAEPVADADAPAAGAPAHKPVGALTRKYRGFGPGGTGGIHDVVAANGVVVAASLTKDEADAMVAASQTPQ